MPPTGASVFEGLAENALRLGADTLELEYKDARSPTRGAGRPSSMLGCSVPGVPRT